MKKGYDISRNNKLMSTERFIFNKDKPLDLFAFK